VATRLSAAMHRMACGNCHYVIDRSALAGTKAPCPHCGYVDFPFMFPHDSSLDVLDMVAYFHRRAEAAIRKRNDKLVESVALAMDRIIDAALLVSTALEAQDVYNLAGEQCWEQHVYDQILQVIQDRLGLPSRDDAVKAWAEIGSYSASTQEHKVVVVLTCTFLEQLLDGRLIVLAMTHDGMNLSDSEDKIYDDVQGWNRKKAFFSSHVGVTLDDAIEALSPPGFNADWAKLRKVRNTFVHETIWAIGASHAATAFRRARQAVPVFAELQNRYCIK
jgi:hypothetical protein